MRNLLSFSLLILFGSLAFFSSTLADSKDCKDIQETSTYARLVSDVRPGPDDRWTRYFKPTGNCKNGTNILIYFYASRLNFYEWYNTLEFRGSLVTHWNDERLTWNNASYDNIKSIKIQSNYIWTPDIAILSAGYDNADEHGIQNGKCEVYANGFVWCQHYIIQNLNCQTDFRFWPYDRHNCTFVITSWSYTSEEITLKSITVTFMEEMIFNGEWKFSISRISNEGRESNYFKNASSPQISIDIQVDRMHTHLRGRYVTPAIIMAIMTLTTLWLDPKSIERLAIAAFNVIVHMLCMMDLHWVLPHNGTTVPNILLFYVDSFVLATVALLLTFFLGKIKETKVSTPKWISSNTALVLRSKAGQLLLLGMLDPKATAGIEIDADDTDDLFSSKPKETAWTYVAILVSWISFIIFLFAYIIMYAVLIPSPKA